MFPLIIILFLAQLQFLHAEEFPLLMKRIQVEWADVKIADQINSKPTWSTDGLVPNFIFCGPFKTSGKDGSCDYIYQESVQTSGHMNVTNGSGSAAAKLISTINDTYSCMSFDNPMPDFVNVYSQFASAEGDYEIKYTCQTSTPSDPSDYSTMIAITGLVVLFLLAGVGVLAYKLGQKKNASAESLRYGAYETSN